MTLMAGKTKIESISACLARFVQVWLATSVPPFATCLWCEKSSSHAHETFPSEIIGELLKYQGLYASVVYSNFCSKVLFFSLAGTIGIILPINQIRTLKPPLNGAVFSTPRAQNAMSVYVYRWEASPWTQRVKSLIANTNLSMNRDLRRAGTNCIPHLAFTFNIYLPQLVPVREVRTLYPSRSALWAPPLCAYMLLRSPSGRGVVEGFFSFLIMM